MFGKIIFLLAFFTSHITFANSEDNSLDSAESCYLPIPDASKCPDPSTLKINTKTNQWTTDSGWKSDGGSFTKSISKFLGAQWKGVDLGQILCLYMGPDTSDFPVGIHKNLIVRTPMTILDGVSQNSNYKSPWILKSKDVQITLNCYSTTGSTCDCPFITYVEKTLPIDEVINSIQQPSNYPAWGGY